MADRLSEEQKLTKTIKWPLAYLWVVLLLRLLELEHVSKFWHEADGSGTAFFVTAYVICFIIVCGLIVEDIACTLMAFVISMSLTYINIFECVSNTDLFSITFAVLSFVTYTLAWLQVLTSTKRNSLQASPATGGAVV